MTKRLQVYVSDDAANRWRRKAEAEGMPLGHWIANRVREAENLVPDISHIKTLLEESRA